MYCLRSWLNFISSANEDYLAVAFLSYAQSCSIFSAPQQLQQKSFNTSLLVKEIELLLP